MIVIAKKIIATITLFKFIPLLLIFKFHPKRFQLIEERNIWIKTIKDEEDYSLRNFIWLLKVVPEYRNIIYFRVGGTLSKILNFFAKGIRMLYISGSSTNIGTGLVIQHGYSTVINAAAIGVNCQVWHNVTIGTNKSHSGNLPTIKNNVKICAGAIVLGDVIIGNNVIIGAGAVVTKSIPDNSIVVGNPAFIIKRNGVRVNN